MVAIHEREMPDVWIIFISGGRHDLGSSSRRQDTSLSFQQPLLIHFLEFFKQMSQQVNEFTYFLMRPKSHHDTLPSAFTSLSMGWKKKSSRPYIE